MQVNQDLDIHIYYIRSYDEGEVVVTIPLMEQLNLSTEDSSPENSAKPAQSPSGRRIQQETLKNAFVIQPKKLIREWPPQAITDLTEAHVQALAEEKPEVVIIGTGKRLTWPERSLLRPLIDAGIGYEIMDTAAACRTYNILSYEGRDVLAAIMMI